MVIFFCIKRLGKWIKTDNIIVSWFAFPSPVPPPRCPAVTVDCFFTTYFFHGSNFIIGLFFHIGTGSDLL